jgi:uncharacterized glyoxalase superfamily protein PhnB
LHGFALAHDFAETGHLYVSYSVADSTCAIPDNIAGETNAGCWHLSRFTVEDGPQPGSRFNGALACDNVERTYEELKGRGVALEGPPQKQPWGPSRS